jgi:hypothetical protein
MWGFGPIGLACVKVASKWGLPYWYDLGYDVQQGTAQLVCMAGLRVYFEGRAVVPSRPSCSTLFHGLTIAALVKTVQTRTLGPPHQKGGSRNSREPTPSFNLLVQKGPYRQQNLLFDCLWHILDIIH